MPYRPPRDRSPTLGADPLEIALVFGVTACGTCEFFWPNDPSSQPYGPYPAFDIRLDQPISPDPDPATETFPWATGRTAPEAFPTPELLDGCRKAPIMTIGINPNLTAFAPGQTGTSWAYPNFGDDDSADLWTKYAYYYRYRSVFQERFGLDFMRRYLAPDQRVVAARPGAMVSADRPTSDPSYVLKVRYDGDPIDTEIPLTREPGSPRWVLLFDTHAPNDRFEAGDLIAARLDVPPDIPVEVLRQQVGYYEQFVPVLRQFEDLVRASGHPDARLRMGEDVCQLDMVACASPHWNPGFLGGTPESERTVIDNCVARNAWAMRQLVQTRPAVLYLVGEATWNMFRDAFGALVVRDPPLSDLPPDGAFTLLRETTDPAHPCRLELDTTVDGSEYRLSTRLVVTPHFSYSANFTPQFRLRPEQWQALEAGDPACAAFLTSDPRLTLVPPVDPADYTAILVNSDAPGVLRDVGRFPESSAELSASFVDPHQAMSGVLAGLLADGTLAWGGGALSRTDGACSFCDNTRWRFPDGCPYGKPAEQPPPAGYLERVAAAAVAAGRPA